MSQCLLQVVASAAVFSNATTVPAVNSIAKLTGYTDVAAFNATERTRVGSEHSFYRSKAAMPVCIYR